MAYIRRSGMPRSKKGHTAHTRMGLPRGNPLSGGGNFKKPRRAGRGARLTSVVGRRRY